MLGKESAETLSSMGMVGLASNAQADAGNEREGAGAPASRHADERVLSDLSTCKAILL
jgi:hypothetical protein